MSSVPQFTPKRGRPIGVILLGLTFLWIGVIGTLIFPIMAALGGLSEFWKFLAKGIISSPFWLRITGYVLNSIWFFLCVAYLFIGVGLFKLRNWARKSVAGLNGFAAVFCAIILPLLVKPAPLAVAVVIGTAPAFAGIAWYMMRPRVRWAFSDSRIGEQLPPPLSRIAKAGVVAGINVILISYGCSLFFAVESTFRDAPYFKMALEQAQNSPCAVQALGRPVQAGWAISGSSKESASSGSAELSIPVHGPRGKGDLRLSAGKKAGKWTINSLVLLAGDKQVSITPSNSDGNCR
jgi:hypothetical protein